MLLTAERTLFVPRGTWASSWSNVPLGDLDPKDRDKNGILLEDKKHQISIDAECWNLNRIHVCDV
jgi:hypothetical protein